MSRIDETKDFIPVRIDYTETTGAARVARSSSQSNHKDLKDKDVTSFPLVNVVEENVEYDPCSSYSCIL